MKVILTHIGSELPPYIASCLRQFRLFNPQAEAYLIAGEKYANDQKALLDELNILPVFTQELEADPKIEDLRSMGFFQTYGKPKTSFPNPDNYWNNIVERLFFLETFISRNNFNDVFHFENDVLIYCDLEEIKTMIDKCPKGAFITPVCEKHVATAMFFIDRPQFLTRFCEFVLRQLSEGEDAAKRKMNVGLIFDMTLLACFSYKEATCHYFPILPKGDHSYYFQKFDSIFDGASWGQFVGGTNLGDPPGFASASHYVGQELLNKRYKIVWESQKEGRVPFVMGIDGQKTKLNNLHIHSKKLENFLSG